MQALRAMNTHAPIPRGLPALSALGLSRLGSSSPMPPCPLASRSPKYSVLRTLKSGLTFARLHRPPADLHLCTVSLHLPYTRYSSQPVPFIGSSVLCTPYSEIWLNLCTLAQALGRFAYLHLNCCLTSSEISSVFGRPAEAPRWALSWLTLPGSTDSRSSKERLPDGFPSRSALRSGPHGDAKRPLLRGVWTNL